MEKDNKYYGLIEKLVKNHRKFSGYEDILEEIINDVYAHSVAVITSIDNESVIQSYLQRVVSTSIITVPKRLNFNNARSIHRTVFQPSVQEKTEPVVESVSEVEPVIEDFVTPAVDLNDNYADSSEVLDLSEESTEAFENEETIAANELTLDDFKEEPRADKELVDKMINSIGSESIIEPVIENSEEVLEFEDELDIQEDSIILDSEDNEEEVSSELLSGEDFELSETEELSITEEEPVSIDAIAEEPEIELEPVIFEEVSEEVNFEESVVDIEEQEELELTAEESVIGIEEQEELELSEEESVIGIEKQEELELSEEESVIDIEEQEELELTAEESVIGIEEQEELELTEEESVMELEEQEEPELLPESEVSIDIEPATELIIEDTKDEISLDAGEELLPSEDLVPSEELTLTEEFPQDDLQVDLPQELPVSASVLNEDEDVIEPLGLDEDTLLPEVNEFNDITVSGIELAQEGEMLDASFDLSEGDSLTVDLAEQDSMQEIGFADNDFSKETLELSVDSVGLLSEEEKEENIKETAHKAADYSVFDFAPIEEDNDVDSDMIADRLIRLNSERPELNVIKIFDLKYKQNYTIENIANELSIDKDSVVNALDEIVDLI